MEDDQEHCKVYLNVYDIITNISWSSYLYYAGIGVHHSGVVIFGEEFCYGAHDENSSGIFTIEPRNAPECLFRTSLEMGEINISLSHLKSILNELGTIYTGNSYHILTRNCNHFSRDLCHKLLDTEIPGWINRLARTLYYIQCLVPMSYLDTMVTVNNSQPEEKFSGTDEKVHLFDGNTDLDERRRLLEPKQNK